MSGTFTSTISLISLLTIVIVVAVVVVVVAVVIDVVNGVVVNASTTFSVTVLVIGVEVVVGISLCSESMSGILTSTMSLISTTVSSSLVLVLPSGEFPLPESSNQPGFGFQFGFELNFNPGSDFTFFLFVAVFFVFPSCTGLCQRAVFDSIANLRD